MLKTPEQAADAMMRSDEFVQAQHDRPGIAVAAMRARDAEVAAWLDAEAKKYGDRTTSHEEDEAIDGIVALGERLKKTTPADRARTWKALAKREWRRRAYYQRRLSVLRMALGRTLGAIDAGEDPLAAIERERAILGRPPANVSDEELRGCTCGTRARPCPPHDLGISNATKGGARCAT